MKASRSERERSKPRTAVARDRLSMPGSLDRGPCACGTAPVSERTRRLQQGQNCLLPVLFGIGESPSFLQCRSYAETALSVVEKVMRLLLLLTDQQCIAGSVP
jgi:hypothetical protein